MSGLQLESAVGLVRLGGQLMSLDLTSYKLWQALAVVPSEATARALATQVSAVGADHLSVLASNRLLATWSPDPSEAHVLAASHALCFTGACVGNGESPGPTFLVADAAGRPRVRVNVVVYEFLLAGAARASVAEECERLEFNRLGLPADPAAYVVAALPELMRAGLVRVDLAAGDG